MAADEQTKLGTEMENGNKNIKHAGVVEEVTREKIYIRIVVASQCAACHAKGFCSIADVAEKRVEIPNSGQSVHAGDNVQVVLQSSQGLAAVWWMYTLPLLLLVSILLFLLDQNMSEIYSALFALGVVAVYYGVLWFFRSKFKKNTIFALQ